MYISLTKKLTDYNVISKDDVRKFVASAVERSYKKGDYFLRPGQGNKELGFVLSGVFRYYLIDDSGEEDITMFIAENEMFTELNSFHEETPAEGFVQAETDATILVIEREKYKRLTTEIKNLEFVLKRISQERLTEELLFSREIVNKEAAEAYLLFREEHPSICNRIPDKHLASYLGITKYSLSRIKSKIGKTSQ